MFILSYSLDLISRLTPPIHILEEEAIMDFNKLSYDDLDQYAVERLVYDEEEMSPILKGHIFIEKVLETLISNNLPNSNALFKRRRSFELKLDIARAMDLIDEKHFSAFCAINNLRNNYAHIHDYKVNIETLNSLKFEWADIQHKAFKAACDKGPGEAARIAIIFLCWKAINLIKQQDA